MIVERITVHPDVCGGKPSIRGLRFPVSRLLGLLASGETEESILKAYPYLEPEDIREAQSVCNPAGQVLDDTAHCFDK
jgi:uncharacterized protein (DUF433 family)